MKIPLCKPSIDEKELNLIKKSIKTGWLTHGPENVKFESNFNKLINSKYSISMNSCTSALECAIKCLEKKGKKCFIRMGPINKKRRSRYYYRI